MAHMKNKMPRFATIRPHMFNYAFVYIGIQYNHGKLGAFTAWLVLSGNVTNTVYSKTTSRSICLKPICVQMNMENLIQYNSTCS